MGHEIKHVIEQSPVLSASAGLTDETFCYVFAEAAPAGSQALERSESIEVLSLTIDALGERLNRGEMCCGRMWTICHEYLNRGTFPL